MFEKLGERLKRHRQIRREMQKDLAALLGVGVHQYQRYEAGKVDLPSSKLLALADHFGVSTDYLLGRTDELSRNDYTRLIKACQDEQAKSKAVFAERLKACRNATKLTQKEAAKKFGVDERYWQKYEAGDATPTYSGFLKLADFFGVSLDYLAGRTDDPDPPRR